MNYIHLYTVHNTHYFVLTFKVFAISKLGSKHHAVFIWQKSFESQKQICCASQTKNFHNKYILFSTYTFNRKRKREKKKMVETLTQMHFIWGKQKRASAKLAE